MPLKRRSRNLYDPASSQPYKLSRSRLENFIRCPRCFYLDRRLGIDKPSMPGFTLNSAVDVLLKKEFDVYRTKGEPHPLMKENGVDAIPYQHDDLDIWRENFKGLQYHHKATNLIITGAIDDVWAQPSGQLIIVDYKSTSKDGEVSLDDEWKESYKRQMEIYQWIMRNMGFDVSNTGYFVYANGRKDLDVFDGTLCFNIQLLPYVGDSSWVEKAVNDSHQCLQGNDLPEVAEDCEYCVYRTLSKEVE
ncbi:MAG: PD-(D/E)XK nuclease family protein [Deltaproteobacteria bacterium]|nr:PD-(D/E)XK nuclease family protein [Deltaproteobacteria bacterium]